MREAGCHSAFVKLAHGSSASGVVAYRTDGTRHEALTTVEMAHQGGELRLYNSRLIRRYHPDDLRVALANRIEDRIEFIEFLDTEDLDGGVNDEWETRSVDSDISSTIEVIPRDDSDSNILNAQKDSSTDSRQSEFGLPTPRLTPTPPKSVSTPSGSTPATPPDAPDAPDVPDAPIAPQRRQPRQEIFGNPEDPRNIIEGSRTRRPKQRNKTYAADLARPEQMLAYHSAFALGILEGKPKIHEKDLLPLPRFWKDLQRH